MKIEILYTAWNRLEFTQVSFELLKRNTDWNRVSRLVVYDDGSEDGTREWLQQAGQSVPVRAFEIRDGGWRSLGATMNDFISETEAEWFAKVDNDIAMPPGWLKVLLSVQRRHPDFDLLGVEAGWTGGFKGMLAQNRYSVTKASHIGGVGLMRTHAFEVRRPIPIARGKNGRAGFTIWQHRYHVPCAWVTPDIPNVQLDKIPEEPWASLSERYVEEGWARPWDPYTPDMERWWRWLPSDPTELLSSED